MKKTEFNKKEMMMFLKLRIRLSGLYKEAYGEWLDEETFQWNDEWFNALTEEEVNMELDELDEIVKNQKIIKSMQELHKYELVNKCETHDDIIHCIKEFSVDGKIQGRTRTFDSEKMIKGVTLYFENEAVPNVITREYGLRQQAMYIKYYENGKS